MKEPKLTEELYREATPDKETKVIECPACGGDGYIDDEFGFPDMCNKCNGEGSI